MEKKNVLIIVLCAPLLLGWHWFDAAARKNRRGITALEQKKYDQALQEFMSARGDKPDSGEVRNNIAASLYEMKKYSEAMTELAGIDRKKSRVPASVLDYNMGNATFRQGDYQKALEYYKKSLLANPEDSEARKNFELTQKKIQEQEQQKQQQQQQQQQQDKQNKQDQPNPNQPQQKPPPPKPDYQPIYNYLDKKEKEQMEKKKRAMGIARCEKDW